MLSGVIGRLRQSLGDSARSFREVFRNPDLRRLELAWIGSITGEWAFGVALAVLAYEHGGAAEVGIVVVARQLSSAVAAPFLALAGDRFPRQRVLLVADVSRALAMSGAAAVALSDGPVLGVYALAVFVSLASKTFRPAQAALLPSLARTPDQLTAANVASTAIESTGSFAGPALGGLLLAATSSGVVFAATAATFLWSALLVRGIRAPAAPGRAVGRRGAAREAFAGFGAILGGRDVRLIVGLYAAQTLLAGALNVLVVVAAIELLQLGTGGVGFLYSAVGIGGLVGVALTFALVGRRRLAADFGVGIVLWGFALVLVGLWPEPALALLFLGLLGVGNTLVDVAGVTLMQRAVPEEVLARVFGALESVLVGTLAIGALLAPVLIDLLGIRTALVVTGALLPLFAALAWRRLAGIDRTARGPEREVELLRGIPMFAPLPAVTLEQLAHTLESQRLPAGAAVFRQGEAGDRFYIVADGEVEVSVDGRATSRIRPGGSFGEVALLRDVPRTATVRTAGPTELLALGRDAFIAAVTGHASSLEAANAAIGAYRLPARRAGSLAI
jgi:MFS family permease